MADPVALVRKLGHSVVDRIWRLGFAARFLIAILRFSGAAFRRLPLTVREVYFSGVLSLLSRVAASTAEFSRVGGAGSS